MSDLTRPEILKIVNRYIGVDAGYLGDFSYRTHSDFYPEYCDLDIDPDQYEGTTRQRFIKILHTSDPISQAKILRGILERFPISGGPESRTEDLKGQIYKIIQRLERAPSVSSPNLQISSSVVERAITDAEMLISTSGATSGVDRIHTALHGYLIAVCEQAQIQHPQDASLVVLFKLLRKQHPKLQTLGPRPQDIEKVLNASGSILDVLNPVRNRSSVAHPNPELLDPPEAMLVIHIARTILHYLDSKLS